MAKEKKTVSFLDLPLDDLMPLMAKHLEIKHIFAFRCCSRYCKELADSALATTVMEIFIFEDPRAEIAFPVIVQNCRRLRSICLYYLDWLTDEMFIDLITKNPQLEILELSSYPSYETLLTPKALYPVAEKCKKLTILILFGNIIDETLLKLINLHEIRLVKAKVWDFNPFNLDFNAISDEAFAEFLEKQPRLQHLSITGEKMSARVFATIARICKDLRCLEIEEYEFKSEDVNRWENLLDNCPKLKDVCLYPLLAEERLRVRVEYDEDEYERFVELMFDKDVALLPLDSL